MENHSKIVKYFFLMFLPFFSKVFTFWHLLPLALKALMALWVAFVFDNPCIFMPHCPNKYFIPQRSIFFFCSHLVPYCEVHANHRILAGWWKKIFKGHLWSKGASHAKRKIVLYNYKTSMLYGIECCKEPTRA